MHGSYGNILSTVVNVNVFKIDRTKKFDPDEFVWFLRKKEMYTTCCTCFKALNEIGSTYFWFDSDSDSDSDSDRSNI